MKKETFFKKSLREHFVNGTRRYNLDSKGFRSYVSVKNSVKAHETLIYLLNNFVVLNNFHEHIDSDNSEITITSFKDANKGDYTIISLVGFRIFYKRFYTAPYVVRVEQDICSHEIINAEDVSHFYLPGCRRLSK